MATVKPLYDELTPTQKRTCDWLESKSRLLLLSGDVRAGKTAGLCFLMVAWSQQYPGANHVALGRSLAALQRNVLPHLKAAAAGLGLRCKKASKDEASGAAWWIGNGLWHLIGVPNEAALEGVWGAEFVCGLVDDATRLTAEALPVVITRFNRPRSKLALTCNPSSPNHPLKRRYFDQAEKRGAVRAHADIRDNPAITPEVVRGMERELYGHHKRRALFGEWAGAVGMIYEFVPVVEAKQRDEGGRVVLGADLGLSNATAAVVMVETDRERKEFQVQEEYYYGLGHRTVDEHAEVIAEMYDRWGARAVHVDPSAKSLILALRKRGVHAPRRSTQGVELSRIADGVAFVDAAFRADPPTLTVAEGVAPKLLEEASSYEWDERATGRGEDVPVKQRDHALDALRYAAAEVLRKPRWMEWAAEAEADAPEEPPGGFDVEWQ